MKCLSICQPYAGLVITGKKTIELRTWNTKFRGEFLVHAPIKVCTADCTRLGIITKQTTGAIVGIAEIYDTKRYESTTELKKDYKQHLSDKEVTSKRYGFMIRRAKSFRIPIPWKGQLGLFDVDRSDLDGTMNDKTHTTNRKEMITDIIDEEQRYRLVGHH